jgi:hypothetical protein
VSFNGRTWGNFDDWTHPNASLTSGKQPERGWDRPLTPAVRLRVAALIGATAFIIVWLVSLGESNAVSDWDQCWLGARALLGGQSPYAAVNADSSPWGLNYPLPAVLVSLPFAFFPLPLARGLFAGVGSGLLAYALSTRWLGLLPFVSGAYVWALLAVQWTPLLIAGALISWLSAVLIVKPTTGLALAVGWPTRQAIIGAFVLLGVSFIVDPGWVGEWRAAVGALYHVPPILRPYGWVLLLALLRWRDPRGRFLAAFALMPQAAMPYDSLPLLLIPRSFVERAVFVAGTQLLALYGLTRVSSTTPDSIAAELWPVTLGLCYLPALVMVLRLPQRGPSTEPKPASPIVLRPPEAPADRDAK